MENQTQGHMQMKSAIFQLQKIVTQIAMQPIVNNVNKLTAQSRYLAVWGCSSASATSFASDRSIWRSP